VYEFRLILYDILKYRTFINKHTIQVFLINFIFPFEFLLAPDNLWSRKSNWIDFWCTEKLINIL